MSKDNVTQADREAAAKLLGYRDWVEATDYRTTGREDQKRELVVQALAAHRLTSTAEAERQIAELRAENERLKKWTAGQWFYPADGHDQDHCMWSPDEVIDWYDFPPGDHVAEVNVATSLPAIWCAVRVTADEDADERYAFTEHATKEEAEAALASNGGEW